MMIGLVLIALQAAPSPQTFVSEPSLGRSDSSASRDDNSLPLTGQTDRAEQRRSLKDRSGGPTPIGNPGEWVGSDDYPASAMRIEAEGVSGFLLTVGPDGVPTDCQISRSSGTADLDLATCALIKSRARFNPATDRRGKAVASTYSNKIRWEIPETDIQPNLFADVTMTQSFTVQTNGRPTDCVNRVVSGMQPPNFEFNICSDPSVVYEPFRDEAGREVARRVTIVQTMRVGPAMASPADVSPPADLPAVSSPRRVPAKP